MISNNGEIHRRVPAIPQNFEFCYFKSLSCRGCQNNNVKSWLYDLGLSNVVGGWAYNRMQGVGGGGTICLQICAHN